MVEDNVLVVGERRGATGVTIRVGGRAGGRAHRLVAPELEGARVVRVAGAITVTVISPWSARDMPSV
jgi:hypothetical protein